MFSESKLKKRNEIAVMALNEFKLKNPFFKRLDFIEFLQKKEVKSSIALFAILNSKGLISKTEKSSYFFTKSEPVYIGLIDNLYKEITKSCNEKEELVFQKENDDFYINYLKEKGYLIFKPL